MQRAGKIHGPSSQRSLYGPAARAKTNGIDLAIVPKQDGNRFLQSCIGDEGGTVCGDVTRCTRVDKDNIGRRFRAERSHGFLREKNLWNISLWGNAIVRDLGKTKLLLGLVLPTQPA